MKSLFFVAPFLMAGAFYSFAGMEEQMPVRTPVVLEQHEICADKWTCRDDETLVAMRDAAVKGDRPLRIASYNVHKCTGMDAKRDPERIAEVIRSLDVDIISLQEVLSDPGEIPSSQVRLIAEKTGMYVAVAGATKVKKDGRYGNALLSRFPISKVRLHDISHGSFEPRGIIDADIMVGGQLVRVVSTHFGLWPSERNRQADRLLEILPDRPASPLIMMGDMNGWVPGSSVLRRLNKRLGKPVSKRSFPAPFPILALDKIWVLPSENIVTADVRRSPLTRVASDHLPVVALVYLRALSSAETAIAVPPL